MTVRDEITRGRTVEVGPTPDLAILLHDYGMAFHAQAVRPTDEGQTTLGEAALAVYAHVDAMAPLIRQAAADQIAVALLACITCGKPHEQRTVADSEHPTWTSPDDGHTYATAPLDRDAVLRAAREIGATHG